MIVWHVFCRGSWLVVWWFFDECLDICFLRGGWQDTTVNIQQHNVMGMVTIVALRAPLILGETYVKVVLSQSSFGIALKSKIENTHPLREAKPLNPSFFQSWLGRFSWKKRGTQHIWFHQTTAISSTTAWLPPLVEKEIWYERGNQHLT